MQAGSTNTSSMVKIGDPGASWCVRHRGAGRELPPGVRAIYDAASSRIAARDHQAKTQSSLGMGLPLRAMWAPVDVRWGEAPDTLRGM
jgi:hypothetical protein